ncbi:hypothetical protein [Actinomadura macra]|uniref:hypothetical protein n=1 Tax=Actinomadura macra TaxID=46164 RepID=UPI001C3F366A|nr:hypothetical protein [Actinomadura macra]
MIAAKVAGIALGLALDGVGESLGAAVEGDVEEFNKKLKELPPTARTVVRELGGALVGLKGTAQSAFFAPMQRQARGLGRELRVPVGRGIATITASMGRLAAQVLGFAREAKTLRFIRSLSLAIARGFDGAAQGVRPLLRGIRDFAGASLGSFGRAGGALGRLMARVGGWLSRMARGGQATRWLNNAVNTLKTMGRIGRNVVLTIGAIFRNAGAGSNGGLLATIEQVTAGMLAWSQSAEGQEKIAQFFALINHTAADLATILPLLVGPLGLAVQLIQALPGPSQDTASQFLAWAVVIGVIAGKVGPLAKGLWTVGKAGATVGKGVGRGARGIVRHLRDADSVTRRSARRIGSAFTTAGRGIGRGASAAGRAAGRMAVASGRMAVSAGRAAVTVVAAGARMAGAMAMAGARVAGQWLMMAGRAVISAAIMAAQWLIAFWPVALVVAAAGVAVFLIIKYWDQIKKFFVDTLPKYLKKGFDFIVTLIKNGAKYGFFGPVGLIIAHWDKIKHFFTKSLPGAVSSGIHAVTGWLTSLPRRVLSAVGDMGHLLVNAGKSLLIGLWNGLVSMAGWLSRSIGNLIKRIVPGPVLRVLGIHSPSRLFQGYGKQVVRGMALGITQNTGIVSKATTALGHAAARGGTVMSSATTARTSVRSSATTRDTRAPQPVRLIVDLSNASGDVKKLIRRIVRTDGRGDVQLTFGTARTTIRATRA